MGPLLLYPKGDQIPGGFHGSLDSMTVRRDSERGDMGIIKPLLLLHDG